MDVPHTTVFPHMSTSDIKREVLKSDSDLHVDRDIQDIKGIEGGELTVCDAVHIKPEPSLQTATETFPISPQNNICNSSNMSAIHSKTDNSYTQTYHSEFIPSYNMKIEPLQSSADRGCHHHHEAEHADNDKPEDVSVLAIKQEDNTQHTGFNYYDNPNSTLFPADPNNFNQEQLNESSPSSADTHIESTTECDVLLCGDKLKTEDKYSNINPSVTTQEDELNDISADCHKVYNCCLAKHTGEKPHSCNLCSKRFTKAGNLNRHMITHSGEKPHVCKLCSKRYTRACYLKDHMLSHSGEKPYSCQLCSKGFSTASHIRSHMFSHSGERRHSCTLCDRRFKTASQLNTHTLSHSIEKPYCKLCSKSFSLAGHLKRHMLTHSGEKPHSCKLCSKRFSLASNRNTHMLTHSGEKPHLCKLCSKRFTEAGSLKRHILTHSGEKSHSCKLCSKKFSRASNLTKHLATHTGN